MHKLLATVFCLALSLPLAQAQDATASAPAAAAAPAPAAAPAAISKEEFLASLPFQDGAISLPGNIATLKLPDNFRYLNPEHAARLLAAWGNPPNAKTLGMIVPTSPNVLESGGWAVVLTYDKDGHIADGDADSIDYDKLLKEMQEGIAESNAERKKAGYAGMTLLGWAERPSYDKASHKMVWAKQIRCDDSERNTLNYNVRVLGREGVLVLNAVAEAGQLDQVKQDMQTVMGFTQFTDGNRYTDFNSKTDKVAEYGLAALVAGGVAAKLGLFGKLFALLLAFKKIIFVAVAALGATVFKRFKRAPEAPVVEEPAPLADGKVSLKKPEHTEL